MRNVSAAISETARIANAVQTTAGELNQRSQELERGSRLSCAVSRS